jgi:hypothetical protein
LAVPPLLVTVAIAPPARQTKSAAWALMTNNCVDEFIGFASFF